MQSETYQALNPKEKAFVDLLLEVSKNLKRLADLMDRELQQ